MSSHYQCFKIWKKLLYQVIMARSPGCWTHKTENKTWWSKIKITRHKTTNKAPCSTDLLWRIWRRSACWSSWRPPPSSRDTGSWWSRWWAACCPCLQSWPIRALHYVCWPIRARAHLGICLTTVTVSSTPPTPATLVKLLRLCSSALIFLSSCSSEMMCRICASELPVKLL